MFAPLRSVLLVAAACAVLWVPAVPAAGQQPKKPAKPDDVLGTTKVLQIDLVLTAKEYEAMQPPAGGGFGGFGPPPPANPPKVEPKPGDPKRDIDRSVFGTEFPWAHATFGAAGVTLDDVGLRYKGNSTYLASARGLKRSFKVEFDHHNNKLKFSGLTDLNLHCGVHDPSKIREALCYAIFRACGVPAPRTAFAEVTLTVAGKYDKEYLGLYTATEQVNKTFLNAHYKTDKGLLMKPERMRSLDYLGDDWEKYATTYQPRHPATKDEAQRVIDFAKLVNRGDDAQFNKEIASYLDVDAFLRFMAATSLVSNLDSFFTNGHNYYLYLHPKTKKFHFIPWDVDLALGNFAFFGTPEQQMDLSLTKPYMQCRLADRVMAVKEHADRYQQIVKELAATAFTKERLLRELGVLEAATKDLIAKDAKAAADRKEGGGGMGFGAGAFGRPPELRTFVEKRTESVAAQLDGKSKGYVPQFGFGPPGGFGPGNQLAKPLLDLLDANKDGKVSEEEFIAGLKRLFPEWDVDKNGVLDQKEIADGLQKLLPAPKKGP